MTIDMNIRKATQDDAQTAGANRISLIVTSENEGAHSLYLKLAYRQIASDWLPGRPGRDGGEWLLMVRELV